MCAIKSFRINMHASVDSKGLTWTLSHLESAFTKKRGEGYGEMKTLSPPANNPSAPSNAAHQSLKTKTAPLEPGLRRGLTRRCDLGALSGPVQQRRFRRARRRPQIRNPRPPADARLLSNAHSHYMDAIYLRTLWIASKFRALGVGGPLIFWKARPRLEIIIPYFPESLLW
jgi:hypothetical protein